MSLPPQMVRQGKLLRAVRKHRGIVRPAHEVVVRLAKRTELDAAGSDGTNLVAVTFEEAKCIAHEPPRLSTRVAVLELDDVDALSTQEVIEAAQHLVVPALSIDLEERDPRNRRLGAVPRASLCHYMTQDTGLLLRYRRRDERVLT
jgi:hypothetical protein